MCPERGGADGRVEVRGAAVPHCWPGSGGCGAGARAGGPRAVVMAGTKGRLSTDEQEQVRVNLHLASRGEDKGLGSVTPMMVTSLGRPVCPFPRVQVGAIRATVQGIYRQAAGVRGLVGSGRRPGGAPGGSP